MKRSLLAVTALVALAIGGCTNPAYVYGPDGSCRNPAGSGFMGGMASSDELAAYSECLAKQSQTRPGAR
jgi:hypothetical protein